MAGINELPPELACPILETLIIDDIFNIRLTSRSFSAWIDYYIPLIAYRVARNTFPKARLLLRPTYDGIYDLAWLRTLIPRRLASIALDKDSMRAYNPTNSMRYRIPAEDDFGDQLRERVTGAWCLLRRIGVIYQDVYALPHDRTATLYRESLVCERVLSEIASLEPHQCEAFFILAYVLLSAFHDENCRLRRWRYYLKNSVYKDSDGFCFFDCRAQYLSRPRSKSELESAAQICEDPRNPDKGNSWVWYWLFREGADAFWQQWGLGALRPEQDQPKNYVGLRLQNAWHQRPETQVHIERETAGRIWYALMARSKAADNSQQSLTPPPNYNSLMNPSNEVFPMLDNWYSIRDQQSSGAIATTMLEWYLWQEGRISIDDELAGDCISSKEDAYLRNNSDKLDSLRDVPYLVCFKTAS